LQNRSILSLEVLSNLILLLSTRMLLMNSFHLPFKTSSFTHSKTTLQHNNVPGSIATGWGTRGVSHCGLAIYIKKYRKHKKNHENSNVSPCKNIIFKKSSERNQNPSRYCNSITKLKFQHKPRHHLSKILI
jgi:hypothetical protein